MMANTLKLIAAPAYMVLTTPTNIYTPPAATIQTVIKHIHFANVTAGAITITFGVDPTTGTLTAGKELAKGLSIPANTVLEMYFSPGILMTQNFLVGFASGASSIVIAVMGEQYVV